MFQLRGRRKRQRLLSIILSFETESRGFVNRRGLAGRRRLTRRAGKKVLAILDGSSAKVFKCRFVFKGEGGES